MTTPERVLIPPSSDLGWVADADRYDLVDEIQYLHAGLNYILYMLNNGAHSYARAAAVALLYNEREWHG